jgi:hypothetical protein
MKNNKKFYEEARVEVIALDELDVITTSNWYDNTDEEGWTKPQSNTWGN